MSKRSLSCALPPSASCSENSVIRHDVLGRTLRYSVSAFVVALAARGPAVARGYPPSVFDNLPQLLERAGPGEQGKGSTTGIFSVLVDGDDRNAPFADAIRGTLNGHIVLDRIIAGKRRFPAVNVLTSISRLAQTAWTSEQHNLVTKFAASSHATKTRELLPARQRR
jgi:flagellum-specific ATP synthase